MADKEILIKLEPLGNGSYILAAKFDGNEEDDATIKFWHGPDKDQMDLMDYLTHNLESIIDSILKRQEMISGVRESDSEGQSED